MSVASVSWWLARGSSKSGPFTAAQLKAMGQAGQVFSDMMVWRDGAADWVPAANVKGLVVVPAVGIEPPAPPVVARVAAPVTVTGHVTTEKTGKGLKANLIYSWVAIVIGAVMMSMGIGASPSGQPGPEAAYGLTAVALGFSWLMVTRVRIWWNHG